MSKIKSDYNSYDIKIDGDKLFLRDRNVTIKTSDFPGINIFNTYASNTIIVDTDANSIKTGSFCNIVLNSIDNTVNPGKFSTVISNGNNNIKISNEGITCMVSNDDKFNIFVKPLIINKYLKERVSIPKNLKRGKIYLIRESLLILDAPNTEKIIVKIIKQNGEEIIEQVSKGKVEKMLGKQIQ